MPRRSNIILNQLFKIPAHANNFLYRVFKMAVLHWEPCSVFCFPSGPAAVSVVYRSPQEKNWYCPAICCFYYFFPFQQVSALKFYWVLIIIRVKLVRKVSMLEIYISLNVTVTHRRSAPCSHFARTGDTIPRRG